MAKLMPLPLTVSCSSKIQIGFTFLVPAYPDCPGKEAVKWLLSLSAASPRLLYVEAIREDSHGPGRYTLVVMMMMLKMRYEMLF